MHKPMPDKILQRLEEVLDRRVLVLDGGMGTLIQQRKLDEAAWRGARFADHRSDVRGNSDLLVLTQPQVIADIHDAYLAAGADVVETCTFTATSIAQDDYGLGHLAHELNVAAARIARLAADEWTARTPQQPRFVAGSIGPTNRTLSISPRVEDPGYRAVTFAQMRTAYAEQVRGLVLGGVDLLLAETVFDTLNLKACLMAMEDVFAELGHRLPVMVSVTIADQSGRTLSGQTVEAFWTSIAHAKPFSVGLNCGLGAGQMRPYLGELAAVADVHLSVYPNAGLPDTFGAYRETPAVTARLVGQLVDEGLLDVVGGCCGTTPQHIAAIVQAVQGKRSRAARVRAGEIPLPPGNFLRLSGLEPLVVRPDSNFIVIGERTNVTGSKRFADLIKTGAFGQALEVALDQVRGGANVLDVNMDEGLLDSEAAMTTFLRLVASEPEIARLPIMVDSSKWSVLEAGLECLQGKGIVNSLSLKDGEAEFLRRAAVVRQFGAAVVVMAFDEVGQGDTAARKVAICERAYALLVGQGWDPQDIVFDPNVLAVGTGLEEHARYALEFLEATRQIKARCPGARVSGGVSNLSFAVRGNQVVREAMNSVFLGHAIRAGLDMGIVNAGQIAVVADIEPELLERVEDVLLDRRLDATERLVELAERLKGSGKKREHEQAWRTLPLRERIAHALVSGTADFIEADVEQALREFDRPLDIIEGPMMDGMRTVGDLFGAGKMFLPQVVKSARVMKKGVATVLPHLQGAGTDGERQYQGTVLLATVKGDVHDIGKNIVGVVLGCNNYRVVDLGVLQPADKILDAAVAEKADVVGLSGLITPSLDEMVHVAKEMQRRGLKLPLLIGGATTSRPHTAVKIATEYDAPVVHVLDASRAVNTVASLLDPKQSPAFADENRREQANLREVYATRHDRPLTPLREARDRRLPWVWKPEHATRPAFLGRRHIHIPLQELLPYIDWTFLFVAWELKGKFPQILEHPTHGEQARDLYQNAQTLLQRIIDEHLLQVRASYGFWPAESDGDDLVLFADGERRRELTRFPMLRQQQQKTNDKPHLCLADFVAPRSSGVQDWVGAFAVTAGLGCDELAQSFEAQHDDYQAILAKSLADRLVEAAAEYLHEHARRQWYAVGEKLTLDQLLAEQFRGIRPAFGYPACPDHTDKRALFTILGAEQLGMGLTDHLAMTPAATVSGLYLGHPDADYFPVGRIGRDQLEDYARRKGMSTAEVERWLSGSVAEV
jgi:5-methyltetrahydrofolate--homocysteine methyltransferase